MILAMLAATLLSPQDVPGQEVPPPWGSPECAKYIGIAAGVGWKGRVARQGDEIELSAWFMSMPGAGADPVPAECVRDWKIEKGDASLTPDHKVRVAADTPPGTEISFSAVVAGRKGYGSFVVRGRDEARLDGLWHQAEVGPDCGNARRVLELGFGNDRYSYSFRPQIETMVDGGGTYRWDAATGGLTLEGDIRATGRAELVDPKTLVIDGIVLDREAYSMKEVAVEGGVTMQWAPAPVCRITLYRLN